MDVSTVKSLVVALVFLQIVGTACATQIPSPAESQPNESELEKRGGARAFYGFNNGANRLNDPAPYLYYKRGGGRSFAGGFRNTFVSGSDKRGGGRAFAGSWRPQFYDEYFDAPYYRKRSLPLYAYLEGRDEQFF